MKKLLAVLAVALAIPTMSFAGKVTGGSAWRIIEDGQTLATGYSHENKAWVITKYNGYRWECRIRLLARKVSCEAPSWMN